MVAMSLGLGAVFVGVTTAANAGVPPGTAGLAAALLNASQQLGAALGPAIFAAIATSRIDHLLIGRAALPEALRSGFSRALLASSIFLLAAAVIATRTIKTRGEETRTVPEPLAHKPGDLEGHRLGSRVNPHRPPCSPTVRSTSHSPYRTTNQEDNQ